MTIKLSYSMYTIKTQYYSILRPDTLLSLNVIYFCNHPEIISKSLWASILVDFHIHNLSNLNRIILVKSWFSQAESSQVKTNIQGQVLPSAAISREQDFAFVNSRFAHAQT